MTAQGMCCWQATAGACAHAAAHNLEQGHGRVRGRQGVPAGAQQQARSAAHERSCVMACMLLACNAMVTTQSVEKFWNSTYVITCTSPQADLLSGGPCDLDPVFSGYKCGFTCANPYGERHCIAAFAAPQLSQLYLAVGSFRNGEALQNDPTVTVQLLETCLPTILLCHALLSDVSRSSKRQAHTLPFVKRA